MRRLLSWHGGMPLNERLTYPLLSAHLESCIKAEHASFTLADTRHVSFRMPWFYWKFRTQWSPLIAFDDGELRIDSVRHELHYVLGMRRTVFGVLAGCAFIGAMLFVGEIPNDPVVLAVLPFSLLMTCLSMAINVWRFRRFLQRSLESAPARPPGARPYSRPANAEMKP